MTRTHTKTDLLTAESEQLQISRRFDLQDLLAQETIGDGVAVVLGWNCIEGAHKLTKAFVSLARRVDVSRFSLWISFASSSVAAARIVADGLHVFRGLKNVALVFTKGPRSISVSRIASVAIRSLKNPLKSSMRTLPEDSLNVPRGSSPDPLLKMSQRTSPLERSLKATSITDLPREIRHIIINHVINDGHEQSATLMADEPEEWEKCCGDCLPYELITSHYLCACPRLVGGDSTTCSCGTDRFKLFFVNRTLYADSTYVLYSTNRVILRTLKKTLRFLLNASDDTLRTIHMLDVQITIDDYPSFFEQTPEAFKQIINIIKNKCNLSRLHLSIDSTSYSIVAYMRTTEGLHRMRTNITDALKPLHGLDRLDIYLSGARPEDEDRMEKAVMGDDYDAIARGKLHMHVRDGWHVHKKYREVFDVECDYPGPGDEGYGLFD